MPAKYLPLSAGLPVEAMQLPKDDKMVAEKDREEKLRAIGAWVYEYNGYARIASGAYLIVDTLGGEMTALPGHWIVKHSDDNYSVWSDSDFAKNYKRASQYVG